MRQWFAIVCCMVACLVWAQPQVTWIETSHDFGTFNEERGKVSCAMRFINTGNEPLVIHRVRTSCGCTAVNYPKHDIAPGDTASITLTYTATHRPGSFEKDVFVYTNTTPGRYQITISGHVIGSETSLNEQYPVRLGGARLKSSMLPLGDIAHGSHRTAHMTGINSSLDTLLVSVIDTPAHIRAAAVPDTVAPGEVFVVSVGFEASDDASWGFNSDRLTVESVPLHPGSGAIAGMATIEVMAQVTEDFSSLTEQQLQRAPVATLDNEVRVSFGQIPRTQAMATQAFTIANTGHDELIVRRLWIPAAGVTATCDRTVIKAGKHASITVTLDTRLVTEDLLNTQLHVITNDPSHPAQVVRVVAQIIDTQNR